VDPGQWIKLSGKNLLTYTDDVFATFFLYCNLAGPGTGPENCAFYTGSTPHDIFLRFEAIVTQLNATEAYAQGWSNATAIELLLYGIKDTIFEYSYNPILRFPGIAQILAAVENILPNLTLAKLEALENAFGLNFTAGVNPADVVTTEIICSDIGNMVYGETLAGFLGLIGGLEKQSFLAGEFWANDFIIPCATWHISSDDRYTGILEIFVYGCYTTADTRIGPFGGQTKNPILFVSNTIDVVTPIQKQVQASFNIISRSIDQSQWDKRYRGFSGG
jgi:hypothetical protein